MIRSYIPKGKNYVFNYLHFTVFVDATVKVFSLYILHNKELLCTYNFIFCSLMFSVALPTS